MNTATKPNIGISCGDLNGIGIELIIKAFSDMRVLELCTPVIFASNKIINFYRKSIPDVNFNYQSTKELSRLNNKQINVFNCWEEEVTITPGQLNDTGGNYAIKSLRAAVELSLIHISEPTRQAEISYAVFCLKKKNPR